ncbi:PASTA domain-containing protein [Frankia tisae]|uniref:PASTA domain-containing protein n=1 Tax=Frankia tisae TaxID=2950104 RepID=UPI0021BEBEBB|nr:PASTA domain-containing protein [Frankia tisae]
MTWRTDVDPQADQPTITKDTVYLPVNGLCLVARYELAAGAGPSNSRPLCDAERPDGKINLTARNGQVAAQVSGQSTVALLATSFNGDRLVRLQDASPAAGAAQGPGQTPASPLSPSAPPTTTPTSPPPPTSPPSTPTTPAPPAVLPRAPRAAPPPSASQPFSTPEVPGPSRTPAAPPAPAASLLPQGGGAGGPSASPPGAVPTVPAVTVPDVTRMGTREGCQRLRDVGLLCSGPQGDGTEKIERTAPTRGESVPRGTEVTLTFQPTAAPATMPNLIGQPYQQACQAVPAKARCTPTPGGVAPDITLFETVSAQQPPEGTRIDADTAVSVTYYASFSVPDLTGRDGATACDAVRAALACTTQQGPAGSVATAGKVVQQSVPPGTQAAPGTALTVTIAGAAPVVPNVVGLDPAAACAQVQQAGLICTSANKPSTTPNVSEQSPVGSTSVDPNTAVTVYSWSAARQPILRFRKNDNARVWLLRGEGTTAQAGYEQKGEVGASASASGRDATAAPFLKPIVDYQCPGNQCGADINHFVTDGAPPGGVWTRNTDPAGWVFKEQYAGTVPLYRLADGTGQHWAYASEGSGALNGYVTSGFSQQTLLGYVWPAAN